MQILQVSGPHDNKEPMHLSRLLFYHQLTYSSFDVSEAQSFKVVLWLCNSVFLCCQSILLYQCPFELGHCRAKTSQYVFFFSSVFLFHVLCNRCMLVLICPVTCNSKHWVIGISTSLRGSQEEIWGLSCHSSESHWLHNHNPKSTDGYLGLLLLLGGFPANGEHYFLTSMPIPAI